ncbi:2-phospho-L-lactate guanylyltransferase [Mariprofundus micogutta]|uniref:2-phospho-L-lactate guanylyltransferase n=1 Tax=Mariprofundus micogutta TaxID=1921010 RepID=A0A1L8CLW6_9PROT|nr:TIGR04282 family arsenosugar biosynthesis glycosyltransferase [Mariprofundus micogutta]GAV19839.1 2-phospho-L-lactate guanylyltransferase [Mariprofundus micogutta]
MKLAGIRVVIMCKAPVKGRVKTRLMTALSAEHATAVHAAMATTVIERTKRLFDDVVLAADDIKHPFFTSFGLPVLSQHEGNLGDRMHRQVSQAFEQDTQAVLLLGTDSPHMPDARLLDAAAGLQSHDVVLGSVEDGGYDLIAMNAAHPVFDAVDWSTPQVLPQTLNHIRRLQLTSKLLDVSFDVDLPSDIERARTAGWQYAGL